MTFADITAYFERLAIANKKLQASYVGDYDSIYVIQANPDKYKLPAMWIESAEMVPTGDDDTVMETWSRAIVILFEGSNQDPEKNKYQLEQSYRVARSILYRIMKDTESMRIKFTVINKALRQIDPLASDYLVGWRIELEIQVNSDAECYDPDEWDETIEPTKLFDFLLEKTSGGYQAAIIHPLPSGWEISWKYSLENAAIQTDTEDDLTVTSSATDIYVICEATHTASGIKRHASAFLRYTDIKMMSVPYLYTEYRK